MFRKPKKKPSSLRGASSGGGGVGGGASGGVSDEKGGSGAGKKRIRRRRTSSSSDEGTSDDDGDEGGTSGLLQQLRQERDANKSNKSSSATLLNTSSTSSKKKKSKSDDSNNWMHQYKSTDNQMTAQEMATRTAEYHPTENTSNNAQQPPTTTANNTGEAASKNAEIAALQKQPRSKFLAGPIRAATFVRTTARFDYQPDICKDYKETGFCGFGDTCIYLHDRGDTKTGWQMEQEYEEKKKREAEKKGREMEKFMESMMCGEIGTKGGGGSTSLLQGDGNEVGGAGIGEDDGIPFACHICRSAFQNPIVTSCGHYFCEKCMLSRIRGTEGEGGGGTSGCPICKKDTHGVLNHPQKLVAKKRRLVGRDGSWEDYLERSRQKNDGDE